MNKRYRVAISFVYEVEALNDNQAIRNSLLYSLPYGEESNSNIRHLQVKVVAALPLEKAAEIPPAQDAPEQEKVNE
jgi:hypothetical protein